MSLFAFMPFFVWGVYQGATSGYVYTSYSLGFLWMIIVAFIAYHARLSSEEVEKLVRFLLSSTLILALLSTTALLAQYMTGIQNLFHLDYYNYGIVYIFSFGCLYTITKVFLSGKSSFWEKLGFILFSSVLVLLFAKKVLTPTLVGILIILLMVSFQSRHRLSKMAIVFRIGVVLVFSTLIGLILGAAQPSTSTADGVIAFYQTTWKIRYLHLDTGDVSGGRFMLWNTAMDMLRAHPFSGYGIGIMIRNPGSEMKPFLSVHSTFMHFFLALGLIGGLLLVILIYYLIRNTARSLHINDRKIYLLRLTLFGYICGFVFLIFFDMFSVIQIAYVLFALFVGILLRFAVEDDARRRNSSTILAV